MKKINQKSVYEIVLGLNMFLVP